MALDNDLYCQIFIDGEVTQSELIWTIARLVGGKVERYMISTDLVEVSVFDNRAFDEVRRKEFPDGFLSFRYYLEVVDLSGENREAYVATVARILEHFWACGYPAVASCDYEDELPQRGGYQSESVPWPAD